MSAHQIAARIAYSTSLNIWDAPDAVVDELFRLYSTQIAATQEKERAERAETQRQAARTAATS